MSVKLSIIIPTYNEEKNLSSCLSALSNWSDDIHIIDSNSSDETIKISVDHGANVIQYVDNKAWPKKRQWAIDNLEFKYEWILLVDADEILLPEIKKEIEVAINDENYNGYSLHYSFAFLGKDLKFAHPGLRKTMLFRKGYGFYEKLLDKKYSNEELPIEVHEHFIIDGECGKLKNSISHRNVKSLYDYIEKHNRYSEWSAEVFINGINSELKAGLFGNQASRRRYLRKKFGFNVFSPFLLFIYFYFIRMGLLDGKKGFYYCAFQAFQVLAINAKVYERTLENK